MRCACRRGGSGDEPGVAERSRGGGAGGARGVDRGAIRRRGRRLCGGRHRRDRGRRMASVAARPPAALGSGADRCAGPRRPRRLGPRLHRALPTNAPALGAAARLEARSRTLRKRRGSDAGRRRRARRQQPHRVGQLARRAASGHRRQEGPRRAYCQSRAPASVRPLPGRRRDRRAAGAAVGARQPR